MTTIGINKGNRFVEYFRESDYLREIKELILLYESISPDLNFLLKILSSLTASVSLCPENGKWRCAAVFTLEEGKVAIFFPWIISGKCQRSVVAGIREGAETEDAIGICQEVISIFKENLFVSKVA